MGDTLDYYEFNKEHSYQTKNTGQTNPCQANEYYESGTFPLDPANDQPAPPEKITMHDCQLCLDETRTARRKRLATEHQTVVANSRYENGRRVI